MTTTPYEGSDPTTDEEFHDQLQQLIRTAEGNDVNVAGGWPCRADGPDQSSWDVEILEVRS